MTIRKVFACVINNKVTSFRFELSKQAAQLKLKSTHRVDEARFVLTFLTCPSRATPCRSLLEDSDGIRLSSFFREEPGATGHPSLWGRRDGIRLSSFLREEPGVTGNPSLWGKKRWDQAQLLLEGGAWGYWAPFSVGEKEMGSGSAPSSGRSLGLLGTLLCGGKRDGIRVSSFFREEPGVTGQWAPFSEGEK